MVTFIVFTAGYMCRNVKSALAHGRVRFESSVLYFPVFRVISLPSLDLKLVLAIPTFYFVYLSTAAIGASASGVYCYASTARYAGNQ